MAYRPDQWLLSVAEGHSKWVYSYQIAASGTPSNKERFFPLQVADWDDDAGAECISYSSEGRQFIATRSGIQISAADGPIQVILTVPDRARVTGVALGGRDRDTLYAFCGSKIWKRKVQHHAMGAWSPWAKVTPNTQQAVNCLSVAIQRSVRPGRPPIDLRCFVCRSSAPTCARRSR